MSALNPSVVGGVDCVIVSGKPPWSPRSKFNVAEEPTSTSPKFNVDGIVVICAGAAAVPCMASPKLPTLCRGSPRC